MALLVFLASAVAIWVAGIKLLNYHRRSVRSAAPSYFDLKESKQLPV